MTYEEAKSIIENRHCNNNEHCRDECMYGKGKCEYDMAFSALEKQIPMKPTRAFQSGFFWCADCERAIKMRINHSKINIRYCPFCGRALDWGDKE